MNRHARDRRERRDQKTTRSRRYQPRKRGVLWAHVIVAGGLLLATGIVVGMVLQQQPKATPKPQSVAQRTSCR